MMANLNRDENEGLIWQCPHCGYMQPYILIERLRTRVQCPRCGEFDVQDYEEYKGRGGKNKMD